MINSLPTNAQIFSPVKWSFSTEQNTNVVTLLLKARIEEKWHLYSQDIGAGGPIPTSFVFDASADYELIEKTIEPKAEIFHDPNFDMDLKFFSTEVVFRQTIKVKSTRNFSIKGRLEFMACNDRMCLPPDQVEFNFDVVTK